LAYITEEIVEETDSCFNLFNVSESIYFLLIFVTCKIKDFEKSVLIGFEEFHENVYLART